jgi:large subunit ribosomal protein L7/L12
MEDPTEPTYSVILTSAGLKKVETIKAIRAVTGYDLKVAQAFADSAPTLLAERVTGEEATNMKTTLENAGASVEVVASVNEQ